jgi:hypothetical protein
MQQQNANNHARYVPVFHFVLFGIILITVVLSGINLYNTGINIPCVILVLLAISFLISFFKMRSFPLAAQDRAIRAEENLRHLAITGKLLDKSLSMSQVIALRFADDSEFVALATRAVNENLSNKEIKQAIKKWRADHHRA